MEALIVIVALIVAFICYFTFTRKIIIEEHERGLKFINGKYRATLMPGAHRFNPQVTRVRTIDMRERYGTIAGQEVLSADGVSLRVSMIVIYRIEDPYKATVTVQDLGTMIHLMMQGALRELVGNAPIDDLLEKRNEIGDKIGAGTASKLAAAGVTLIQVDIRDIMFPGPLRQTFAQVVEARKQAEASLERARGEQAALRSLANTARLLERNPGLLQLRMLQALNESSGNTIVLGALQMPGSLPPPVADAVGDVAEE